MPGGERVRLTFTSFDLVPEVCGDFVQVYDGYEAGSSSFSKYDIMLCTYTCFQYAVRNTRGICVRKNECALRV